MGGQTLDTIPLAARLCFLAGGPTNQPKVLRVEVDLTDAQFDEVSAAVRVPCALTVTISQLPEETITWMVRNVGGRIVHSIREKNGIILEVTKEEWERTIPKSPDGIR